MNTTANTSSCSVDWNLALYEIAPLLGNSSIHTYVHALFKHGKTFNKNTIAIVQ